MTKRARGLGRVTAVALAVLIAAPFPAHAQGEVDDLILELTHCRAWADEPGGDVFVIGTGGFSCGLIHKQVVGTVCLVYNAVTVASSCSVLRSSDGSASGTTKPTRCLPGLWQTQVIVPHAHGPDTEVVSDAVLLTCIL